MIQSIHYMGQYNIVIIVLVVCYCSNLPHAGLAIVTGPYTYFMGLTLLYTLLGVVSWYCIISCDYW